jgi:organic hydroperoxide reductase OsmC/OhrA
VLGEGKALADGIYASDTWLGMPGTSHFRLLSDEGSGDAAPCGLALLSAGIAFCYMTQLSRYIENMKLNIRGVRLVQRNPYVAGTQAAAVPIDTHLFLNGEAPEEMHRQLLTIAARTCYLHAASKTPTEPKLRLIHNGRDIALAA